MILICYDGSSDAQAAIDMAAKLLPGEHATVLTVWEPFIDVMARSGAGFDMGAAMMDTEQIDSATETNANAQARRGAEQARSAGLDAQPEARPRAGSIAETILAAASESDAGVVVLGTRGLTGLKSMLLGSVSHAVLQHADRPVLVIPAPDISEARAKQRKG